MSIVHSTNNTTITYKTIYHQKIPQHNNKPKTKKNSPIILINNTLYHHTSNPTQPLTKKLSHRFTIYTYNHHNHNKNNNTAPYTIEHKIKNLQTLITKIKNTTSIYNISSNTALTLKTTIRTPTIKQLVLYKTPFIINNTHNPIELNYTNLNHHTSIKTFIHTINMPQPFTTLMNHINKLKTVAHTLPYDTTIVNPHQLNHPLPH